MNVKSPLRFITAILLIFQSVLAVSSVRAAPASQFYQLLVYHVKDKRQEASTDKYLAEAWLPALHRAGKTQVGVFKTLGIDTASHKKIYVLTAYRSLDQFQKITKQLTTDRELAVKGASYLDTYTNTFVFL